jgi:hypothetical protein
MRHRPSSKQCINIQRISGSVLYYIIEVDPAVLVPLNEIATEKTKSTEKTQAENDQLLDYLDMHPDATLRYYASYMILHIHTNASYLSVSNAPRHIGGLFFYGNKPPHEDKINGSIPIADSIKSMGLH